MEVSSHNNRDSPEYWTLYGAIRAKVDLDDPAEYSTMVKVMLAVLSAVESGFPRPAREALNMARRSHAGGLSEGQLEEQRVALWTLLEGKSCNFQDPGVCAIRALICAMGPFSAEEWETHQQDPLELFLEFCEGAGFPTAAIADALRAVYPCD